MSAATGTKRSAWRWCSSACLLIVLLAGVLDRRSSGEQPQGTSPQPLPEAGSDLPLYEGKTVNSQRSFWLAHSSPPSRRSFWEAGVEEEIVAAAPIDEIPHAHRPLERNRRPGPG